MSRLFANRYYFIHGIAGFFGLCCVWVLSTFCWLVPAVISWPQHGHLLALFIRLVFTALYTCDAVIPTVFAALCLFMPASISFSASLVLLMILTSFVVNI